MSAAERNELLQVNGNGLTQPDRTDTAFKLIYFGTRPTTLQCNRRSCCACHVVRNMLHNVGNVAHNADGDRTLIKGGLLFWVVSLEDPHPHTCIDPHKHMESHAVGA